MLALITAAAARSHHVSGLRHLAIDSKAVRSALTGLKSKTGSFADVRAKRYKALKDAAKAQPGDAAPVPPRRRRRLDRLASSQIDPAIAANLAGINISPVDRAITQAMREGDFDNLPGKGRPLRENDPNYWNMTSANRLQSRLLSEHEVRLQSAVILEQRTECLEQARARLDTDLGRHLGQGKALKSFTLRGKTVELFELVNAKTKQYNDQTLKETMTFGGSVRASRGAVDLKKELASAAGRVTTGTDKRRTRLKTRELSSLARELSSQPV